MAGEVAGNTKRRRELCLPGSLLLDFGGCRGRRIAAVATESVWIVFFSLVYTTSGVTMMSSFTMTRNAA
ncbi:hypothetical protein Pint_04137 [Pistacia integerrima]|uniref:Uncharacterized protein n=1 Tax=Pistacia integerrima TaxID=434235 RepID=A0ACC0Z436_9ROSI|nr:hypothetical protein Pint_04137 [Pistacia integerrima]